MNFWQKDFYISYSSFNLDERIVFFFSKSDFTWVVKEWFGTKTYTIGAPNQWFSIAAKRWRSERFFSKMSAGPMENFEENRSQYHILVAIESS